MSGLAAAAVLCVLLVVLSPVHGLQETRSVHRARERLYRVEPGEGEGEGEGSLSAQAEANQLSVTDGEDEATKLVSDFWINLNWYKLKGHTKISTKGLVEVFRKTIGEGAVLSHEAIERIETIHHQVTETGGIARMTMFEKYMGDHPETLREILLEPQASNDETSSSDSSPSSPTQRWKISNGPEYHDWTADSYDHGADTRLGDMLKTDDVEGCKARCSDTHGCTNGHYCASGDRQTAGECYVSSEWDGTGVAPLTSCTHVHNFRIVQKWVLPVDAAGSVEDESHTPSVEDAERVADESAADLLGEAEAAKLALHAADEARVKALAAEDLHDQHTQYYDPSYTKTNYGV